MRFREWREVSHTRTLSLSVTYRTSRPFQAWCRWAAKQTRHSSSATEMMISSSCVSEASPRAARYGATGKTTYTFAAQSVAAAVLRVASPPTQRTRSGAPGRARRSRGCRSPSSATVNVASHVSGLVTRTRMTSTASQNSW